MKQITLAAFALLIGCASATAQQPASLGSQAWRPIGNFNCPPGSACSVVCGDQTFDKANAVVVIRAPASEASVLNVYDTAGNILGSAIVSGQTCVFRGMGFTPLK
jgi:hypothetical protein